MRLESIIFLTFIKVYLVWCCCFDYNNDGYEDLFLTSGQGKDILYRNNGDGKFSDVTEEAGLVQDLLTVTTGVSTADINKDGFIDIFITTIAAQKEKSSR